MTTLIAPPSAEVHAWPVGFGATFPTDRWLVVHALPRQDKRLAFDLARRRMPGLMFIENRVRQYEKSTQTFQVPLIAGYLFVNVERERRVDIWDTLRVVRIIDVADPAALARDLENLRNLINAAGDLPLEVKPELVAGKTVVITQGTFAGCEGVVQRRKGKTHLIVNLHMLGQSVATTIPLATAELLAPR